MDRTSAVQSNSKPIGDANVSTPQQLSINKQIKLNQDKSYYESGIGCYYLTYEVIAN